jgi:(S)-2-hydroxyglutarate dehydrogenase
MQYDVAIIGGGIVGLATAFALTSRYSKARIIVLEKEASLASHQSGHNSGVIHSGIYYRPGSLKARFACDGNRKLFEFCKDHDIRAENCGKLIVACDQAELPLLETLYRKGIENGLNVVKLTRAQVTEREPHCRCLAGLHVPSTGIVNYVDVAQAFARRIQERGAEITLSARVERIVVGQDGVHLDTTSGSYATNYVVNCAGLYSDRVARLMGMNLKVQIIPIRGEYYLVRPEKRHLVRHLIYPVPNPQYPFLGVHFTRMVNGGLHAGPNAVLSLRREGYRKTSFNWRDTVELFGSIAFWRFARRNHQEGMRELLRSFNKGLFVRSLQRLVPEIEADDLVSPHAGVRAQALHRDGRLIDDFVLEHGPRSTHVLNAPSPAATASLPIGEAIAAHIDPHVSLPR